MWPRWLHMLPFLYVQHPHCHFKEIIPLALQPWRSVRRWRCPGVSATTGVRLSAQEREKKNHEPGHLREIYYYCHENLSVGNWFFSPACLSVTARHCVQVCLFANCVYTFDDSLGQTLRINHPFPYHDYVSPFSRALTPHLQALIVTSYPQSLLFLSIYQHIERKWHKNRSLHVVLQRAKPYYNQIISQLLWSA